ncbi:MAG: phosphoglycerate transporter [Chloroflexi bacterium]|nr:phosphoglycerate transporter [Chloroflexota bacterium]
MSRLRLGWFSTGRGPGSRALLKAVVDCIRSGQLDAEIEFVFCSREDGESAQTDIFLKMARDYRLPLVTLSGRRFRQEPGAGVDGAGFPAWRLEYDRAVMARLEPFQPDLCVLAGYMLIVGPEMCRKYDMINLHPAAPGGPAGAWQEVIWSLIESRARETGAMMHLVTPELDRGPVVAYCRFPITGPDFAPYRAEIEGKSLEEIKRTQGEDNRLFRLIRRRGFAREVPLVIATIRAFSEGRVRVTADKKVVDSRGEVISGYDLTAEVDRQVTDGLR